MATTAVSTAISRAVSPARRGPTVAAVASSPLHHFTVDVEEYFQASAFDAVLPRLDWWRQPTRVGRAMDRLLQLLAERQARGTFFVLGWLAARQPGLVRRIADAGHEIASHGWDHRRVGDHSTLAFRWSVRHAKTALEDQIGREVLGFRAPNFSIVRGREWALEVLAEEGYRYDSSLFPVRRPGYGYTNGKRDPHWITCRSGRLAEIPPTVFRWIGLNFPAAGGAYFRLLPYGVTQAALRQCEQRGAPGTFYLHPWELDPDQPRFDVPWLTRLRHYGGLGRSEARLRRLLTEFRFVAIADTLGEW